MTRRQLTALFAALLCGLIALPAFAHGSHSTVNKSIRIDDNEEAGAVDSVNGSIRIGNNAVVGSVETVNGGIRVGDGATIGKVESVNGGIQLGSNVIVERDISAVNGSINMKADGEIGGDIDTVNGGIHLTSVKVAGGLKTVNGTIELAAGTEVFGDLLVQKPRGWNWGGKRKPVKVIIGKDSVVHGDLIFEHEVKLDLDPSAKVGRIVGEKVIMVGADPMK